MAQTMHEWLSTTPQTEKVPGAPARTADNSASESPTLMLLVMLATVGVVALRDLPAQPVQPW